MLGFSLSDPPLLIVPPVWSMAVGCDEFRKGGSRVLASDLVVIVKVGALDSRVLFFLIIIILILDVFFNSAPVFFFGERTKTKVSELVQFPMVFLSNVIVNDLYENPFLYSMVRDLFDQFLEMDPKAFDGLVSPLFELEDHVLKK
ncbi:hypothetical protein Tco_0694797 [Tanacetum coccineum]